MQFGTLMRGLSSEAASRREPRLLSRLGMAQLVIAGIPMQRPGRLASIRGERPRDASTARIKAVNSEEWFEGLAGSISSNRGALGCRR